MGWILTANVNNPAPGFFRRFYFYQSTMIIPLTKQPAIKTGIYTNSGAINSINMTNCNVNVTTTGTTATLQQTNGTFTNCTFKNTNVNGISFIASGGSQITIDGGNYTYDGATTNVDDIQAIGDGTIIRLRNNPVGGTRVVNNGVITNN